MPEIADLLVGRFRKLEQRLAQLEAQEFASSGTGVPTGAMCYFAGPAPAGWEEYTAAQGRYIVGLPAGGTMAGTVGTALADLGVRTITTVAAHVHGVGTLATGTQSANHTHSATTGGPSSASTGTPSNNTSGYPSSASTGTPSNNTSGGPSNNTSGTPSVSKTATDGSHATAGPSPSSTASDGAHTHRIIFTMGGAAGTTEPRLNSSGTNYSDGVVTSTNSAHSHSLNGHVHNVQNHAHSLNNHTHSLQSHTHSLQSHTHSLQNHTHSLSDHTHSMQNHTHTLTTGNESADHSHTITGSTASAGSASVDVTMPYIQLRLCRKL